MNPRFFTTLFCTLFTCTAFSQIYSCILDGIELQYCNQEFQSTYSTNFSLSVTDVIDWNGVGYVKKAYFSPYTPVDSTKYLLENESGQVWFYDENNFSGPALIYDFTLNAGDTISVASGFFQFTEGFEYSRIEVTGTDMYISPSGTVHKRLYIRHIDGIAEGVWYENNVWIEGIGATSGGLLYSFAPSDPGIWLNKTWKAGELIYESELDCVVAVESVEQAGISLYYQNNTIRIERPNERPAMFFVYDMNGKLVDKQEVRQNTNISIDLPRGVYVGLIQEDSGEQYSGKFVVAN